MAAIEHANCHSGLGEAVDPYSNPQNVRKFLVPSVNGQIARLADDKVVHSAIKVYQQSYIFTTLCFIVEGVFCCTRYLQNAPPECLIFN